MWNILIRRSVTYHPDLPVKESVFNELVLECLGAAVVVESQSCLHKVLLLGGQKFGSVGVVKQHPEGRGSDDDCGDTFEDEDPLPSMVTSNTVHLIDQSCEQTSERAWERDEFSTADERVW